MPRTTSGAVQSVLMSDYGADTSGNLPSLGPFIEAAGALVDDVAACAAAKGRALDADRLALLEKWLAAHFYAISDQPYARKKTERAEATYQGQTKMYLEATKYGQMAVTLDTSGCLSAIAAGTRQVATLTWLGKPASEQIPYSERN